jgi:hypothetical protein
MPPLTARPSRPTKSAASKAHWVQCLGCTALQRRSGILSIHNRHGTGGPWAALVLLDETLGRSVPRPVRQNDQARRKSDRPCLQRTAFFTSAVILASSVGVNLVSAY